jgi:hypothetical protein
MKKLIEFLMKNADKTVHFLSGYLIATILPIPAGYGLALAVMAAAGKEYWDSKGNGSPDILDFAATVSGGILGYLALIVK